MATKPYGKDTVNLPDGSKNNPRDQSTFSKAKSGMSRQGGNPGQQARTSSGSGGQVLTTSGYKYTNE